MNFNKKFLFIFLLLLPLISCSSIHFEEDMAEVYPDIKTKLPPMKTMMNYMNLCDCNYDYVHKFGELLNNIYCEPSKDSAYYGNMIWTLSKVEVSYSWRGWFMLSYITLGLPVLFGSPAASVNFSYLIKLDIMDAKHNIIYTKEMEQSYTSYRAIYWGYSASDLENAAFTNSLVDIHEQFSTVFPGNIPLLRKSLLNSGLIKN